MDALMDAVRDVEGNPIGVSEKERGYLNSEPEAGLPLPKAVPAVEHGGGADAPAVAKAAPTAPALPPPAPPMPSPAAPPRGTIQPTPVAVSPLMQTVRLHPIQQMALQPGKVAKVTTDPVGLEKMTTAADGGLPQSLRILIEHARQVPLKEEPKAEKAQAEAEVNSKTHRNHYMRLSRAMQSDVEKFPSMAALWNGSKSDRQKLLKAWVERGENKENCESFVKLAREHEEPTTNEKELMSVQEMMDAHVPSEKIHAIVARGGGVPDADCPELLSLTQFWVTRKRARRVTDTTSQRSETTMQADTDVGIFALPDPARSSCLPPIPAAGVGSGGGPFASGCWRLGLFTAGLFISLRLSLILIYSLV